MDSNVRISLCPVSIHFSELDWFSELSMIHAVKIRRATLASTISDSLKGTRMRALSSKYQFESHVAGRRILKIRHVGKFPFELETSDR